MKFTCCDERRLDVIKLSGTANGIEYLEVRDHLEPVPDLRQRTLFVRLLRPGFTLTADNVRIDGGQRLPSVTVEWVAPADSLPPGTDPALVGGIDDLSRTLVVRTATFGDFSRYTLHLRANSGSDLPPGGFDPRLSDVEFSFKVECPSDFDCAAGTPCLSAPADAPTIDYLSKDFTGFRRLMLDRLSLLAPGWKERSTADLGVALVELLAYGADNLSYRQDAIANEAYLATAHKRVSVRRHARLVDYRLHEGCNARAWVYVEVTADQSVAKGTRLLTRVRDLPTDIAPGSREERNALAAGALLFETAAVTDLYTDLNRLSFYTWGDLGCCLPRGATHATLRGSHPRLQPNQVLVFQEIASPTTYKSEDADPTRRWAVRLTAVKADEDPSGRLFETPPVAGAVPVTEIDWDAADAIPFPVCLSVEERPGLELSVALGNIVLVDHGRTVREEELGTVPAAKLHLVPVPAEGCSCEKADREPIPVRFRPALANAPVTHGYDLARELGAPPTPRDDWWPATALISRDTRKALPAITELRGVLEGVPTQWLPRADLLASSSGAPEFTLETENDGRAVIRFGDDELGQRPDAGTDFVVTYRVGNGIIGNVGAEAIAHIVTNVSGVFARVTNPLPAAGGSEPEDLDAARRDAPEAFRTQERAVTAADYAAVTERRPDVQRAAATFRWTGSWHTVFVTADRLAGATVDAQFEARLRRYLERFRMAGYDLEVDNPRFVALDITLHICVKPGYHRSEVLRAVGDELGTGVLPDGRLGAFHPDNSTFGQPVYLSRIVARAQAVEGVEAVWVRKFERMADPVPGSLDNGVIPMSRLEIAELANDPNFRERGRLTLEGGGGK